MVLPMRVCRQTNRHGPAYFDVHVEAPFKVRQTTTAKATPTVLWPIYPLRSLDFRRPAEWFWVHDRWRQ